MSRWHDVFFFFFLGWMNWTNHWNDFSGPCTEKTGGTDYKRLVCSICSRSSLVEGNIGENSTVRRNLVNCTLPAWMGKQKSASSVKLKLGKWRRKKKNNTHLIVWKTDGFLVISLINHSVATLFPYRLTTPRV